MIQELIFKCPFCGIDCKCVGDLGDIDEKGELPFKVTHVLPACNEYYDLHPTDFMTAAANKAKEKN